MVLMITKNKSLGEREHLAEHLAEPIPCRVEQWTTADANEGGRMCDIPVQAPSPCAPPPQGP